MHFREARNAHLPFAYELTKINRPIIFGSPAPDWSYDDFLTGWQRGTTVIVTVDTQPAGYLRWERDSDALHLADLQIDIPFRRQGIATQAIAYFEAQALGLGCGTVSLVVYDANLAARQPYTNLSYRCKHRDDTRSLLVKALG